MKNAEITVPLFREAVNAIHAGDTALLRKLLTADPKLVSKRLTHPKSGYFANPHRIWFIADNPIPT